MNKGNIKELSFDRDTHTYYYHGRRLNGVTRAIAGKLQKSFPAGLAKVQVMTSYGTQVHKEVEDYINTGVYPSSEQGKWIAEYLKQNYIDGFVLTEVKVSDFENTASSIDIVAMTKDGIVLFDIKTGNFDRSYCTLQLNAYRLMYENCYNSKVVALKVINSKTKKVFDIKFCDDTQVLKLLASNV